jgi:polyphosphate kinase
MEALIEREIKHAKAGREAHLIFKMNALVDPPMIRALYRASGAGVKIQLLVRGTCCLRPGVPGVSENIEVYSVVGRFLEHSRVYYFLNGGSEEVYMGSADLMPRNIDHRVEVIAPIEDRKIVRHICDEVLAVYLADTAKTRQMLPTGSYVRKKPVEGKKTLNAQEWLLKHNRKATPRGRITRSRSLP